MGGEEHSIKEPFEQCVNDYSEHLHMSARSVENARDNNKKMKGVFIMYKERTLLHTVKQDLITFTYKNPELFNVKILDILIDQTYNYNLLIAFSVRISRFHCLLQSNN